MFTLQKIFTDGALFQADAYLTISGIAERLLEVSAYIIHGDEVVRRSFALSDTDGSFEIKIVTPAASFEKYRIVLRESRTHYGTAICEYTVNDVMFGELWLASGQSNMELPNSAMTDVDALYAELAGKNIRIYHVEYPEFGGGGAFPWEPDRMMNGEWMCADDTDSLDKVSALGLSFVSELYDSLNVEGNVPVGFLNATWGGTSMPSWFPKDALDADDFMRERLKQLGNYPTTENWNTRGDCNFQQTCSQYNVKIAPLEGVRVRGVIWYQGENECGGEFNARAYADYLRFYHSVYAKRFGADPDSFMMLSSLIYPWTYGGSGECNVGYLNEAFVETAKEAPRRFAAVPICDLAPSWAYHQGNHPIHPTNKYPLGKRLACLALDNVYGDRESATQLSPAYLSSWEVVEDRIRLTFKSVGDGLFVDGKRPIGLYVAGRDNVYLPAECEILPSEGDEGIMEVWCEAIKKPKHVAYSVQSLEPCCNLWGGKYPIFPFYTDKKKRITIEARPWYDTYRTSVWASKLHDDVLDLFYHPIWHAEVGSEVCPDTAFTLEGQSIRVCSDDAEFGCYVKSYPYNRLDLQGFGSLTVDLYNTEGLSADLILTWDGGEVTVPLRKKSELRGGWSTYKAILKNKLPEEASIERMTFRFRNEGSRYHFVNLEKARLWK